MVPDANLLDANLPDANLPNANHLSQLLPEGMTSEAGMPTSNTEGLLALDPYPIPNEWRITTNAQLEEVTRIFWKTTLEVRGWAKCICVKWPCAIRRHSRPCID